MRRRRAIQQTELPFSAVASHPLSCAADTDLGRRGRLARRPLSLHNPTAQLTTSFQTESSVTVQLHPVSSLGPSGLLAALSLQGGADGPTYSGTTARRAGSGKPCRFRRVAVVENQGVAVDIL